MPKPVEPLSVLRPATEIITAARVRIVRGRKHIAKLNNPELDSKMNRAVFIVEELEETIKNELRREQRRKQ